MDPRWANHAAYLQRVIAAVQSQWDHNLTESKVYPKSGTRVSVKFAMDAKGRITKILNVESTAGDPGSRACVSAITDRAPYGDWTDEMRAAFGEQQEMAFTFYYQ